MTGSCEVVGAELHGHASAVTWMADELRGAFDVAGRVRLTGDAFGEGGQRIVAALNAVAEVAGRSVEAGVGALAFTATHLRASVDTYTERDTGGAAGFSGIAGRLG